MDGEWAQKDVDVTGMSIKDVKRSRLPQGRSSYHPEILAKVGGDRSAAMSSGQDKMVAKTQCFDAYFSLASTSKMEPSVAFFPPKDQIIEPNLPVLRAFDYRTSDCQRFPAGDRPLSLV